MITDPDKTKAKRVAEEMLKQVKFDLAKLEALSRVADLREAGSATAGRMTLS